MNRRRPPRLLTKLELEVMQPLWEAEPRHLTVREIVDQVNEGRHANTLAYTTVQTVLRILKDKRVVKVHAGDGRAHVFEAAVSRSTATSSMVGDLLDRLFGGSARPLVAHLLEHESLGREELEALRAEIDRHLVDDERGDAR